MSGNYLFSGMVCFKYYLWNTRSERAHLNQLTRELTELSSRIESLQPIKQPQGIFRWTRPLLHRVTLGYAFKAERDKSEQPILYRMGCLLFYKISLGLFCSSSLPVLQSVYEEKQRELDLYRNRLNCLGSQRVIKAVQYCFYTALFTIGLVFFHRQEQEKRKNRQKWEDFWHQEFNHKKAHSESRREYFQHDKKTSLSAKRLPTISRPSDWPKQSIPSQLKYLSTWIDQMERKGFSTPGRCPSGRCQFSVKKAHNAWIQPLLKTPAIQNSCSQKTLKACKDLYARMRPGAFFSSEELSALKEMGLMGEGLREVQQKIAQFIQTYCPFSQRACTELLTER